MRHLYLDTSHLRTLKNNNDLRARMRSALEHSGLQLAISTVHCLEWLGTPRSGRPTSGMTPTQIVAATAADLRSVSDLVGTESGLAVRCVSKPLLGCAYDMVAVPRAAIRTAQRSWTAWVHEMASELRALAHLRIQIPSSLGGMNEPYEIYRPTSLHSLVHDPVFDSQLDRDLEPRELASGLMERVRLGSGPKSKREVRADAEAEGLLDELRLAEQSSPGIAALRDQLGLIERESPEQYQRMEEIFAATLSCYPGSPKEHLQYAICSLLLESLYEALEQIDLSDADKDTVRGAVPRVWNTPLMAALGDFYEATVKSGDPRPKWSDGMDGLHLIAALGSDIITVDSATKALLSRLRMTFGRHVVSTLDEVFELLENEAPCDGEMN